MQRGLFYPSRFRMKKVLIKLLLSRETLESTELCLLMSYRFVSPLKLHLIIQLPLFFHVLFKEEVINDYISITSFCYTLVYVRLFS